MVQRSLLRFDHIQRKYYLYLLPRENLRIFPGGLLYGRGVAENGFLPVCYFRSNLTTNSRYHRYGTMFQIIHSSIRM